jgi:hypothetical protein
LGEHELLARTARDRKKVVIFVPHVAFFIFCLSFVSLTQ